MASGIFVPYIGTHKLGNCLHEPHGDLLNYIYKAQRDTESDLSIFQKMGV